MHRLLIPLAALLAASSPLSAQTTVARTTPLLATPAGRAVASLQAGAPVVTGAVQAGFTEVTIEGHVSATVLAGPREQFAISARTDGARLRASASTNARILAELRLGMGLTRVSASGDWVRVRRTGWVATSALTAPARPSAANPAPSRPSATDAGAVARRAAATPAGRTAEADTGPATARRAAEAAAPGALTPRVPVALRHAPESDTLAMLAMQTTLTPLARERGWVRVRVEGWVPEADVIPADTSLRSDLSAADLRADPEGTRGLLVRWEVQALALQTADPLRRGLRNNEPYLLARGPGRENALLYVAVPPALLPVVRPLAAAAPVAVTITARVRDGRSDPVGVPVLDLVSIARR